jgi:WD40-like Beta Propeller Repeat
MSRQTLVLSAALIAFTQFIACRADDRTVPGPESKDLLKQFTGYVVRSDGKEILTVSLPDLKETVMRPVRAENADDFPSIHALSGPDSDGRIAYIEDHSEKHRLKFIRIDGTGDTTIFSRSGSALWAESAAGKGEIGANLALAPRGGRVAFLSALSDKQMPGALLSQGTIEVWDLVKKQRLATKANAIDEPMTWFPDGRRLAFARFVDRTALPKTGIKVHELLQGDYMRDWKELPAVHVLDIESGHTEVVSLGSIPVVSADGKSLFVGSWISVLSPTGKTEYSSSGTAKTQLIWKRVDIATGSTVDVTWPYAQGFEQANGLIANPSDDLVLYWGLPTAGTATKRSMIGSFRAGMTFVTVKAAVVNSDRFQTVLPQIDRRERVSFGRMAKK